MSITVINPPGSAGVAPPVKPPAKPEVAPKQTSAGGTGLKQRNDLLPQMTVVMVKLKDLLSARNPVRKVSNRQI